MTDKSSMSTTDLRHKTADEGDLVPEALRRLMNKRRKNDFISDAEMKSRIDAMAERKQRERR